MRYTAAACSLAVLFGCGGPSVPTAPPTPPPVVYPAMTGGWAGTWTQTWATDAGPGAQTCAETWIITGQTSGAFSGTFQVSGEECSAVGSFTGTVLPEGAFQLQHRGTGTSTSECSLIGGSTLYTGVVSPAGGATARAVYAIRCPYGRGTLDYQVTATLLMNRR